RTLVGGYLFHDWQGSCGVANIPGVLIVGATPLDLMIPGTTCRIMQDLLLLDGFVTDGQGNATRTWALPSMSLAGITLLTQMAFLDAAANSVGIITSNSLNSVGGVGTTNTRVTLTQARSLITQFSS
ncbi:MAG TPA: hypothetical protein PKE00_08575, partial [Planctomycetota bacterium]|nr:hypothetical protein [Planctomycetota bacterium]